MGQVEGGPKVSDVRAMIGMRQSTSTHKPSKVLATDFQNIVEKDEISMSVSPRATTAETKKHFVVNHKRIDSLEEEKDSSKFDKSKNYSAVDTQFTAGEEWEV